MAPLKRKKEQQQPHSDAASELAALQGARADLELGQAILVDELKQCKAENEQLVAHAAKLGARITTSTADYGDILQHREEQVRTAEGRASLLQQQLDRLQADLAQAAQEAAALKEASTVQGRKLEDAAALVADMERLEELLKKQHALIEQRGTEIKVARAQLESKEAALSKARAEIEELELRCKGKTNLHVLFGEPWLVQMQRVRLKGTVPHDREFNTLSCTAGGKQLVLCGGYSRSHEGVGRETAVLNLDSLTWDVPDSALQPANLLGHSSCVVGRCKLLAWGGSHGEAEATAAAQLLATDSMRWSAISPTGTAQPSARMCHAAAAVNDKVYIIGGIDSDGHLLADLWLLDMDTLAWRQLHTFGAAPSPRKGATLCATEDGRRLYLFGGHGTHGPLNDCSCLDLDQLLWCALQPSGVLPEPREGHTAAVLGNFLLVSGGCGSAAGTPPAAVAAGGSSSSSSIAAAAAGGQADASSTAHSTSTSSSSSAPASKRLCDTHVLDLNGPAWEQLCDGAAANVMWLKQMSVSSVLQGNRLLTLQPNLHEQLDQMQIMTLVLPEDIERLRTAKRREQEQVDRLELLDDAVCSSSSIQVSWRPPTENKDRISGFKLLLSTSTGVVREVHQGRAACTTFTCTGLRPSSGYVLVVKATYDDGSLLWSESKAYHTKML